ncbi:MAG: uroporphyrinogen decarboxylase family protein [Candidatus Latescibacteria bacterium]|nr:uroporphyrinogen decarboxylase family protein [Candidatus Latescibacterota bacterium]
MNSRERLITAFEGRLPDRVPVTPRVDPKWMDNAGDAWAGRIIRETDIALYLDVVPDTVLYLGEAARRALSVTQGDGMRTEVIRTPNGPLTRTLSVEAEMMDWATVHFFGCADDVGKALSLPLDPPEVDLSEYDAWERRIGDEGIVGVHLFDPLCCPGLWFSPEEYLIHACVTHTELVEELLVRVLENMVSFVQICLDRGVRHFLMAGAELACQTLMGPKWFSRLVTPYDAPLVDQVREGGGYVWYHCHGKIAHIHREMADLGFHVLTPCEKPPHGDIELAELKASVGHRVCLAGNLDDLDLLSSDRVDEIDRRAQECLADAMDGGRFILAGTEGCVFSPQNAEGYLRMCRVRDEVGCYV